MLFPYKSQNDDFEARIWNSNTSVDNAMNAIFDNYSGKSAQNAAGNPHIKFF